MKNFIQGSILVLAISPLLDEFLEVSQDRLRYLLEYNNFIDPFQMNSTVNF